MKSKKKSQTKKTIKRTRTKLKKLKKIIGDKIKSYL